MRSPMLFKIGFAIVTGCLVFQIIALCAATKAKKRKDGENTDHNTNNQIDFVNRAPESVFFLVLLAVWAIVVCVAILSG